MLAITVLLDGQPIVCVCPDQLEVLSVDFGGTKIDDSVATLHVAGGRYPADGESKHLVWLCQLEVTSGQCVRIEVATNGKTSYPGETLHEMFPDSSNEDLDQPDREQVIEEVGKHPPVREQIALSLRSSTGTVIDVSLAPEEHGFGAGVLWNWVHPEKVSASLHTYSLEQIASATHLKYHFREYLVPGSWFEIEANA